MSAALAQLLAAAKKADEQITSIHKAFGSPGDYGYETKEGRALFDLYRFQIELGAAIKASEAESAQ